jgi:hypothetical protein
MDAQKYRQKITQPAPFTIAAEMIAAVRSGLYALLGDELENLSRTVTERRYPERPTGPLANLDRVRDAMDVVGWPVNDAAADLRIDLAIHRWAIVQAIHAAILKAEDASELRGPEQTDPDASLDALRDLRELLGKIEATR